MSTRLVAGSWFVLLAVSTSWAQSLTAFTYQGLLKDSGSPANGAYDFRFSLFDAASGGTQVGADQFVDDLNVQNGLFTTGLDFGSVWDGSDRWLEIGVRPGSSTGEYTTLSPRVKVTRAPYAARADAAPPVGAAGGDLSGTYPDPLVAGLQGFAVASTAPTSGQVLKWDGSAWSPGTDLRDEFWRLDWFGGIFYLGSVGVGTGNVSSLLHVSGGLPGNALPATNTVLTLEDDNDAYLSLLTPNGNERGILFGQPSSNVAGGIIYNNSATPNGLQFRTNGNATRMVIDGGGNVGIGVSNPGNRLHVETGTGAAGIRAVHTATSGHVDGVKGIINTSTAGAAVSGEATAATGTTYGVYGRSNSAAGYGGYFVGRGYFSDNVGIGTGNPAARLSLGGDVANTKLALWQGTGAGDVMGFGIGPDQFRLHLHNSNNRFSFLNAPNGSELLTILGNGNVGIGTTNPQARLHVQGNAYLTSGSTTLQILPGRLFGSNQADAATLEIPGYGTIGVWDSLSTTGSLHVGGSQITLGGDTNPAGHRVLILVGDAGGGNYFGYVDAKGANGNLNARITSLTGYANHGWMGVYDAYGTAKARMYVDQNGYGGVVADVKNFRVPDPDDPTRDIWYACIEGPEAAMYVRGTARLVNGRAYIELPDHFRKLAEEQGMTVQLTPLSPASEGLCVLRKGLDGIEVAELRNGKSNYEFDWEVKAVRKEHRDFRVYRSWDEVMPAGQDPQEAWEARLESIQDSQAWNGRERNLQARRVSESPRSKAR